jgi:hypothetical protein
MCYLKVTLLKSTGFADSTVLYEADDMQWYWCVCVMTRCTRREQPNTSPLKIPKIE